jgi:hypothetical protein
MDWSPHNFISTVSGAEILTWFIGLAAIRALTTPARTAHHLATSADASVPQPARRGAPAQTVPRPKSRVPAEAAILATRRERRVLIEPTLADPRWEGRPALLRKYQRPVSSTRRAA